MDTSRISRRQYLAERVLATYAGQVTGREVLSEVDGADYDDPVLEELLDLFEHEPAKSRLWGLSGSAYDRYLARVQALAGAIIADPNVVPCLETD
jgi:hypothetical protein